VNLPTLTHAEQIREMPIEEAARRYPVRVRGVVTYYNWVMSDLFVQDSTAGIWVNIGQTKPALHAGEFVQVEGITAAGGLAPDIEQPRFRSLGEAPMPNPWRPTSDALASGGLDSQWVELQGVVRSVAERQGGLVLNLSAGAFECIVFVLKYPSLPTDIVDSQVRIRGVFAGLYDPSSDRFIGFQVLTPSWAGVEVLERPNEALWSAPVRSMPLLLRLTPEDAFTHRVHVRGVVTLQQLGRSLCIRDRGGALLVNTTQQTPLKVGDLIDATGYPAIGNYTLVMRDAIFRRVGASPAPQAVTVSPEELRAGKHNADLVRLSARLLNCTTRPGEQMLELQAGRMTFRAVLNAGANSSLLGSLRSGSLLRLTGVSMVEADENHQARGFEILLRFPADVVVLEMPKWWTARRIGWLSFALAGIVLWASFWVAVLRRQVEERTETIRATLESTVCGILVVDSAGKIVAHNRKFSEMWRIPESALGSHDDNVTLDFVFSHLEHPDAFLTKVWPSDANHAAETDDVIEFKDGRVFERHSEPQRAQGRNVGRVWAFRDITERRRSQEASEQAAKRFNLITSATQDALYDWDLVSHEIWVNENFQRLFGAPERSSDSIDWWSDHLHPEDRERVATGHNAALSSEGNLFSSEFRLRRPDGSYANIVERSLIVRDAKSQVLRMMGALTDISERKRAEEALKESESRLQCIFDSVQTGILIIDPETHRIVDANSAALRTIGRTADQAVGAEFPWLFCMAEKEACSTKDPGQPVENFERILPSTNGDFRVILMSVVAVSIGGRRHLLENFVDITDRKRAKQELERSYERLRTLSARLQNVREEERKSLARELHDQLGQALTTMKLGLYALVHENDSDPVLQKGEALLQLVDESIKRVRQIATELRPGVLDHLGLPAAIEWAAEDFQARTGIRCSLQLPHQDIAMDPDRSTAVFRILQESLTNVVRHAAASEITIRMEKRNKDLMLLVKDNGKGMRMEDAFRDESLGILGMRERAQMFGGEVDICSAPGSGTTVRVNIPQVYVA